MSHRRLCWLPLMLMLMLSCAWAATQLQGTLDHDEPSCVQDNTPVCGRIGSEYLVFANECDRLKARRARLLDELHDVPVHHCVPNCDFACSPQPDPVCGVSVITGEQKTFNNQCELSLMSCYTKSEWSVYKKGECSSHSPNVQAAPPKASTEAKQPLPCTNVFRPVCATYAAVKSTFPNECLVNAENIKRGQKWQILTEGFCDEDKDRMSYKKYLANLERSKANAERKREQGQGHEREKRSIDQEYNFDDLQLGAETVFIYAPSAFHTHFISNDGTFEKRYSDVNGKLLEELTTTTKAFTTVTPTTPAASTSQATKAYDINRLDMNEYNAADHDCEFYCDSYYEPLCVSRNGVNYTMVNDCFLRSAKCRDQKSVWQVIDERECPSSQKTNAIKDENVTERPGFRFTSDYVSEKAVERKPRREMFEMQQLESELQTTEMQTQKSTPTITHPPSTIATPTTEPTTTFDYAATERTTTSSKSFSQIAPSTESTTIMSFTTTVQSTTASEPLAFTIFRVADKKPVPMTRKYAGSARKSQRKSKGSRNRNQTKSRRLSSKTSGLSRSRLRSKSSRKPKIPTTPIITMATTTPPNRSSNIRQVSNGSFTSLKQPPTTTTAKSVLGSNENFLRDYLRKEHESNRSFFTHLDKALNWKKGERTSIYGTDSNSLMMRLLRAKFV